MGIALSNTDTELLLRELASILSEVDEHGLASVQESAERMRAIVEKGATGDRLEVFAQRYSGGVLVAWTEQWYARRVAANNETRAITEAYSREEDAYRGGYGAFPDLAP